MSSFIKLLLANPEKLIQKIFQNFSFPGHEPDRITGKLIHQNFMSTYSVFFYKISSHEPDGITEKVIHVWMSFPAIRSVSRPGIRKIIFFD